MSFSKAERSKLAALLKDVGPDAPTLCEGWTTRDLVAHMYIRENQPLDIAGMVFSPLSGRLDTAMENVKNRDYTTVINAWAAGPPKKSLFYLLDSVANAAEYFVHLEDVRRAVDPNWEPRDFSLSARKTIFDAAVRIGKLLLRKSTKPIVLVPSEGFPPAVLADKKGVSANGDDVVRVTGEAGELLLWVFGRDAVRVSITGDKDAIVKSSL